MRHLRPIAAVVVVLLGILAGVAVRAKEPDPLGTLAQAAPSVGNGIGEDLVLVIADVADTASSAADLLSDRNTAFQEVAGFVTAAADDYGVTGIEVQTSADLLGVECPKGGALVTTKLDGVLQQLECPLLASMLTVFRPVELSFVPKDAFSSYTFPTQCGSIGRPPCQRDRFHEVLGPDGAFRRGTHLTLTAFRTRRGAEEFIDLARTLGVDGLVTVTARKLGGGDVGLGQEPHPDGSGPLTHPLPDQTSYQR